MIKLQSYWDDFGGKVLERAYRSTADYSAEFRCDVIENTVFEVGDSCVQWLIWEDILILIRMAYYD